MEEGRREPSIHEEEAQHVGEPEDATMSELTGEAPPSGRTDKNGDMQMVDELTDQELIEEYRNAAEDGPLAVYNALTAEMRRRFELAVMGQYEIDQQENQQEEGDQ